MDLIPHSSPHRTPNQAGAAPSAHAPGRTPAGRRQRGGIAVEFAIVLPFLMLLLLGTIEYGWMFLKVQQLGAAARHGARIAARPDATAAEVDAAIQKALTDNGLDGKGVTVTTSPGVDGVAAGTPITVTLTVDYSGVAATSFPLPTPESLSRHVTYMREGGG